MKLPLSWLKDYVEVEWSAEELAERLTFSGTEVEGIEIAGGAFEGLIVGAIVEAEPLPGHERLRLCRVSDGQEQLQVVCGAENAVAGVRVAFAPPGAILPNGTVIEEATVAGVKSRGMICAEDELGLSDDHSGVLILPEDAEPGTPLAKILGDPEPVLDLEVTWNRPDCLSVIGMAREVAALLGRPLRRPEITLNESGASVADLASVVIEAEHLCPRYVARVLTGLTPGPAPFWMRRRLSLCGLRPINAIVDVTNYVLLECGQPLHAFDMNRLAERRIIVREARAGERMRTLDEVERELASGMPVIADAAQPVAVAGIMGGAGSEIGSETRDVLLESACFDPAAIRAGASHLGLSTEASRHFERGVDLAGVEWASRRAAALMLACAGGSLARGAVDVFPGSLPARSIPCRFDRVRAVTGMDIDSDRITGILEALEIGVTEKTPEVCVAAPPSFRLDLEEEADLIEEVARIHGLDQVPASAPAGRIVLGAEDRLFRAVSECRRTLTGMGLTEIMNYSFVSEALLDKVKFGDKEQRVALPNPVSADQGLLRPSLVPQMAETLGRNLARQVRQAALFEIGRVFFRDQEGAVQEQTRLALALTGTVAGRIHRGKTGPGAAETFLALKGVLCALAKALHVGELTFEPEACACAESDTATGVWLDGRRLGGLGLLARGVRAEWRMRDPVAIAELELDPLLARVFAPPELKPIPVYPSVARDLAVVADEDATHGRIEATLRKAAPATLEQIRLFDVFRSKELGEGRKSMAYALTYRSAEKTLTDEEVNASHDAVKNALRERLGVDFRE